MQEGVSIVHSTSSNKEKQCYFFPNTTVRLFSPLFQVFKKTVFEHVKIAGIKTTRVKKKTGPNIFVCDIYLTVCSQKQWHSYRTLTGSSGTSGWQVRAKPVATSGVLDNHGRAGRVQRVEE